VMATVTQIGPRLGIAPTCAALGLPRATYYRRRRPARAAPPRRPSPRALGGAGQHRLASGRTDEQHVVNSYEPKGYLLVVQAPRR